MFIESMKELPAALLLRPFNFETLATHVYQFVSDEMLERGRSAPSSSCWWGWYRLSGSIAVWTARVIRPVTRVHERTPAIGGDATKREELSRVLLASREG